VTSVFSEVQFPSKVLDQIAAETGATVLEDLFSDALGEALANSYLGAMRANASAILASFNSPQRCSTRSLRRLERPCLRISSQMRSAKRLRTATLA